MAEGSPFWWPKGLGSAKFQPTAIQVIGVAIAVLFEEGGQWHAINNPPELYDPPFAIKFSSGWIWDSKCGWRNVP